MPTHTIGLSFKTDAGSVPISTVAFTVDSEINQAIVVPAGTTREVDVTFASGTINDYCLTLLSAAGKTEATAGTVTIDWNSNGGGTPSMTLDAKKPIWHAPTFGTSNLFTTDVSRGFFTNAGLVDLVVAVHIGMNLTV